MPKTLLLADDSVTIQKVVGITFANEDVELVTVDNGADALARAKDLKPDMIMADIAMPGLGGYELCAAIRRDPELCHIPVLLLTGTFETYDEQKALLVGASGHIAKPFEAQALISQFYALVDQDATRVVGPPPAAATRSAHPVAPPERVARQAAPVRATPAPAAQQPVARPAPAAQQPVARPAPAAQQPVARPAAAPATRPAPATTPVPPRGAPAAAPAAARPTQAGAAPQPGAAPQRAQTPPRPAAPQPLLRTDPSELPELPNTDFGPVRAAAASLARAPGPAPARSTLIADPNAVPVLPTEIADEEEFAFSDFEFNEATPASNSTDTGFFGEDSQPVLEADAYSETTFLDPRAAQRSRAASPMASADPLADTIPEDPFGDPNDDTSAFARARAEAFSRRQIEEAVPWPDPQPDAPAPAAFDPVYDTLPELDSEPLEAELLEFEPEPDADSDPDDCDAATVVAPHVFANAGRRPQPAPAPQPEAELFAPEPEPEVELTMRAGPPETQGFRLDPADMRSAIEKVAWEAFGALQEQLMRELVARAEAAIWEIVPQIAERLIREEIERIKNEA